MVLQTLNLGKKYGRIQAVNDLSISVDQGHVYGLLGPNGSGKSTTLGMLLNVVTPSNGSHQWFGNIEKEPLRKIGAILEKPCFYPYLSGKQNLQVVAQIREVSKKRVEEVLEWVGLLERAQDKFKTYSLGMKQRLSIASALLPDPEVLILDEPTNGLDPQGIAEVRKLILAIAEQNKTIILASHLLDEVQKVCSHFAVLRAGSRIYQGSVADALESNQLSVNSNASDFKEVLSKYEAIEKIEETSEGFTLVLKEEPNPEHLNKWLMDQNIVLNHLSIKKNNLEQKFLEILNDH